MTRVTTGPPPVQREAEEQALRRIRSNAVTASSEVRRTDHSLIADEVTKEGAAPRDERNLHGVADTAAAVHRPAKLEASLRAHPVHVVHYRAGDLGLVFLFGIDDPVVNMDELMNQIGSETERPRVEIAVAHRREVLEVQRHRLR